MSDDAAKLPVISGYLTEPRTARPAQRSFETRLYQDIVEVAKEVLARSNMDVSDTAAMAFARNVFLVRIQKELLTEKVHEQTWRVEEQPYYPSPRHAFIDTLPAGTFRRRFLSYFWGIDPAWQPSRLVHEVVVKRWVEFPEQGVPKQSIEETLAFWA